MRRSRRRNARARGRTSSSPASRWTSRALPTVLLLALVSAAAFGQVAVGEAQEQAARTALLGEWVAAVGRAKVRLRLASNGSFVLDGSRGTYDIEGNQLTLEGEEAEEATAYQFALEGDQLTLTGGDLAQPLKFARQPEARSYLGWLGSFSLRSARVKLYRILTIAVIVVVSRLLISALRALSRAMILSQWGPLRSVYVHRKNRALTLHSLVLNVAKYVVYFVALGFILTELGINYTAYLASLSVIGLAIAFGSQGLIQDMVTGFFVIFEGQFDVGDMVEISGQTGIVVELGLRMTKLRNYLDQVVVIPNRNIAVVGNYLRGALQTHIDVAMASAEAAEQAVEPLRQVGREIARQFDGVILTKPEVSDPLSLKTGEHFLRMHLAIWPLQQWVVDQQLVPRIREVLKAKGFEIPADRVVAFYRAREQRAAPSVPHPLKSLARRLRPKHPEA